MKHLLRITVALSILFGLSACKAEIDCDDGYRLEGKRCVLIDDQQLTYTISFVLPEELDPIADVIVDKGDTLTLPFIEVGDDYTWYTDAEMTTEFDPATEIHQDRTLYLDVDFTYFTVLIVDPDDVVEEISIDVIIGQTVSLPEVNTEYEYAWYTDSSYETEFDPETPINRDTTLHLRLVKTYTVSIVDPDGVVIEDKVTADAFQPVTLPVVFTLYDYEWYTDDTYETVFNPETIIDQNMTLYVRVIYPVYTITFVVPNDMDPIDPITVLLGETIPLPTIDTNREYGWYTNTNYTFEYNNSIPVTQDLTLYFYQESETVNITYIINGNVEAIVEYIPGNLIDIYTPFVLEGFEFDGWYLEETQDTKFYDLYVPQENITLYGTMIYPELEGTFTSIQDVLEASLGEDPFISVEGIVYYSELSSVYITDGINFVEVALPSSIDNTIVVGDRIQCIGYFHNVFNIKYMNIVEYTIIEHNQELPYTTQEMTFTEFTETALGSNDLVNAVIEITDVLHVENEPILTAYFGPLEDGSTITFYTAYADQQDMIEGRDGQTVTITFIYTGYRDSNGVIHYGAVPITVEEIQGL
ncbi:InlB B-repeat-containing protein [Candidatus Xianfuyuplasma coldseepsis]|uniref:InlB B-repeat-containing protein n=1 Tax=Candidatus Xianfuyuplasma coldseepsis TaxID=2782163 RepID=A0A7L7KR20_9MOLU|nr:InlB B-repeat-containing protein [Xianfuyuplasma coldseepsis]QMS85173.1 InlB B-repeat-containing protein [Xianfuyuplasma coldseepsis]